MTGLIHFVPAPQFEAVVAERDRARSVAVQLEQELHRIETVIRTLHQKDSDSTFAGCGHCDVLWPCDTIRILDGTS